MYACVGVLVYWFNALLVYRLIWFGCVLVRWRIGLLASCFIGVLVYLRIGILVYWFIGLSVY